MYTQKQNGLKIVFITTKIGIFKHEILYTCIYFSLSVCVWLCMSIYEHPWVLPFNPLSQEGGEGCCNPPPPFRIFPRTIFAFLLRLPYGQLAHPLSRHPCIYEKNFQKFLPWKKLGGGGRVATEPPPPRPEREGVVAKINKFS